MSGSGQRKPRGLPGEREKFRVPWDEKSTPGPVPERVKLEMPWDESVPEVIPPLPIPKKKRKS